MSSAVLHSRNCRRGLGPLPVDLNAPASQPVTARWILSPRQALTSLSVPQGTGFHFRDQLVVCLKSVVRRPLFGLCTTCIGPVETGLTANGGSLGSETFIAVSVLSLV
jgi:hypothetical protein